MIEVMKANQALILLSLGLKFSSDSCSGGQVSHRPDVPAGAGTARVSLEHGFAFCYHRLLLEASIHTWYREHTVRSPCPVSPHMTPRFACLPDWAVAWVSSIYAVKGG